MKNLKITNNVALAIPILLLFSGLFNSSGYYFAAWSTMITGILQIIIGVIFLYKNQSNIHIKIYFVLVILFFSLWYYNVNILYIKELTWPLIFTPLILCIYISTIIYSQKTKS